MSSNWVRAHALPVYCVHRETNSCFLPFRSRNISGTELNEAKEKLSRAESSSSDSEDDGANNKRKKNDSGDKPTEEMIEKMEEKVEAANVDQKRLFLIVFQRFIMILSEHLVRCDTDGLDYDTDWYRWTIGRLQQVFLMVITITKHPSHGVVSYY